MYGRLYYREKLKPLVDAAHDNALMDYNRSLPPGTTGDPSEMPKRVTSWTAVVMEAYAHESEDVKRIVQNALQEHAREIDILNKPPLQSDDGEKKQARLKA